MLDGEELTSVEIVENKYNLKITSAIFFGRKQSCLVSVFSIDENTS